MRVKCKLCSNFDGTFCRAKKSGGKYPKVKANNNRTCSKYKADPISWASEADKEYEKRKIPVHSPTWRYYSDEKEEGPKYVRVNPQRK